MLPEGKVTVPVFVPVSLKSVFMGVMAQVIRAAPKDPLRARVSWTVVGKSDGSSTLTWKWKFVKRIKSKIILRSINSMISKISYLKAFKSKADDSIECS